MKENQNVYQDIFDANSDRLDKTAVVYRGIRTTYGTLLKQVEETARLLMSYGIKADDRVALRSPDSTLHIVLALALLKIRAVQIPVEVSIPGAEVRNICEQVSADAFISMLPLPDGWQMASEMQRFTCAEDEFHLQQLAPQSLISSELSNLNPAFIRFTSGTTSNSKGVIISHESVISRTNSANDGLKISSADTILWVLSMAYHFVVTILLFLRKGATIAICESPAALSMPQLLETEKITFLYMSPFHYHLMCESSVFNASMLKHARLAITTAMPMDRNLADKFYAKFNIRPRQAYGIIEVGLPCIDLDEKEFKPGVVGKPLPSCELKIRQPDKNGVGTIVLRSPGMFDGYLHPFCIREDVCENGFFNTGDIGFIDESGQLVIVGRSKNIINFAGMKIFPYEVEDILRSFKTVKDASVYGIKDPIYGEKPQADIVFNTDTKSDDELLNELRKFCYANLAPYKVPKAFNICDELERTVSGKILRRN